MTDLATFEVQNFTGYRLVVANGEIDIVNAGDFRSALQHSASAGTEALIVCLAGIRYLDSNALAILMEVSRRFSVSRRQLRV
ncbi:MAG TPA: STAS domain-containing protein, partial [Candidatus Eremiobacteraceae bacterium]|nr:STAS domain-containing protein [Candidatus Eremiobacteraceae bacterium]